MALPFAVRVERQLPGVCNRFLAVRNFHASSPLAAIRAPSTRRKDREPEGERRRDAIAGTNIRLSEERWNELSRLLSLPDPILKAAISDGIVDAELTTVRAVASDLIRTAFSVPEPVPKAMMKAIHEDMSLLAGITMVLAKSPPHRKVAASALRSLARMDEPISTLAIGLHYLHSAPSSKRTECYGRILKMAHQGILPQAMVLCALFQKNDRDAILWIKKAISISKPVVKSTGIDAFIPDAIPGAWLAYADIMAKNGNREAVREALTIGTDQYDSPEAYLRMARYAFEENDMNKYEEYLSKTAMAGVVDSAYQLGNLYIAVHLRFSKVQSMNKPGGPTDFRKKYAHKDYRMLAQEWYEIAIASGHGLAALVLAGLYRREGKDIKEAKRYLDVAMKDEEAGARAHLLKAAWNDIEWKVDILDDLIKENKAKV